MSDYDSIKMEKLMQGDSHMNPTDQKLMGELSQKINLNNADARRFRDFSGLYPTVARLIVKNAPYKEVSDVLDIPGLSDHHKELLKPHLGSFCVDD